MTTNWSPGAPDRPTSDPMTVLTGKTAALRAMHQPGKPLLLPNAWDVPSARAVVAAGLPAVATSSAAVAEALGYTDGENAPVSEVLDAVARIAAAVSVPVTADMERGYGLPPAELVGRLAAAGIAGCNLEDSEPATGALIDVERQADFLAAVCEAAHGFGLVVNARVDTFLNAGDSGETTGAGSERIDDAIRRGQRYKEAGADCVYPILCEDADAIRVLVRELGTVNILASSGAPSAAALAELGVARISWGPYLHRAVLAHTATLITTWTS
jgi:2-methylisocitrate lyase-like PEP mutase family enzyme